ncbi:hypothetical protein GCM10022215_27430 [Nocardioides fonticola]|uniref:Uncharacterized protein n=1 Tax=Nocardioides fonticola TaxID=450363 RepID=A0ABP7XM63_9ACTN
MDASPRSFEPIGPEELGRIATFVGHGDARRTASRPELAGRLVAGCLAQGAAAHLLDGVTGVKDLDVWLFYDTRGIRFVHGLARNRLDYGPSRFGRHPDDPPRFTGRRVDVMARSVPDDAPRRTGTIGDIDPADGVRAWLAGPQDSPRHLRRRPVVLLWPTGRLGEVVWRGRG